mgnify:FL=1
MAIFCTLITPDYLPFAKTLFDSLYSFDSEIEFYVLLTDHQGKKGYSSLQFLGLSDLSDQNLVHRISDQYSPSSDAFRWSLKSVLMLHLLKQNPNSQVFFVDPDICFYSDFRFLYQELGDSSFLLSPHWKNRIPEKDDDSFVSLFTHGVFNAGFLGATSKGVPTLHWWAERCIEDCIDDSSRGLFVDQKYLDIFPLLSPDTKIISHPGCNVAIWNRNQSKKTKSKEGVVMVNGDYPIVFIHFTYIPYLIQHDAILLDFLKDYDARLTLHGWENSLLKKGLRYIEKERLKSLTFIQRVARKFGNRSKMTLEK